MSASKILQDYIFTSKYARFIPDQNRRETWPEAVNRVKEMMLVKYSGHGIDDEINWAYDLMRKKRVLGSQRALQYGGLPILKKNARIYNCLGSYIDRPRFFQEYFWLLLCGCGAGFSVQSHHVAKLPELQHNVDQKPAYTFQIPDDIEGWSDALGILLTTYFQEPCDPNFIDWLNKRVLFDYSAIRPKGSPLSSGVGKAPGPSGLCTALENIRKLLDQLPKIRKLRPIHAYDICMFTSDAVLSGGVRRSSTIALFSPDDIEMATAKTGDWLQLNPQRARSNNSALLIRGSISKKEFTDLIQHVKEFGEPGFVWSDSPELALNPCGEIGFFCYDIIDEHKFNVWKKNHVYDAITCNPEEIGLCSGWQACNLSTTNCSKLLGETENDKINYYLENVKAAAIIGTLQAGFTNFDYLTKTSENIIKREALLGVSMTGMMDNFDIVLNPDIQLKAAKIVLDTNADIAKAININPAARTTCLKPEGTGTLILGSSAHGCHPHHYSKYLRIVQANKDEVVYQYFKRYNPQACEKSVWSSSDTDDVIYFPIEVPDGAKTKNQLPAIELLKIVRSTQQHWVCHGKRKNLCVMPWLSHNVSNTISIDPNEWDEIIDYVFDHQKDFCGISFVPNTADKDYPQAPNCAVYSAKQIVKEYGEAGLWTSGLIELGLSAFDNLWKACDCINDPDPKLLTDGPQHKFWIKSRRFADRYFGGNYRQLTYCMKDVFNWKRWYDLTNTLQIVDYTQLLELEDNTKPEEHSACAGGTCTIT